MSRGLKNNNPGNIRISATKYEGEIQPSRDMLFKQFTELQFGYRAMFVLLLYTYQKKYGLQTIREMIMRYAPPLDNNNTAGYISTVSKMSGVDADTPITATNKDVMIPIAAAMSRVENGVDADIAEVQAGWKLFLEYLKRQRK
ncbi:MAG: structural protein P5 [Prevotellaceae bacterium]|jgi:hypothetical protein|nr:structural protein P5 [Prevotellaceae bacterium]